MSTWASAQNSLSFYHLGNSTFQNSHLNPAWVSNEHKWLIGLPVMSGVHVHFNNKLSYNELFTKEGDQVTVDITKALGNLQNQNLTSVQSTISLLHLAYKLPKGSVVSLFANERIEVDFLYPKMLVDFVWNGSTKYTNEPVKIGQLGLRANHFREIGVGYAYQAQENINIGIRAKYLVGFLNMSTPGNVKADLTTNGEIFQLEGELKNGQLRSSGLDIYDGTVGDLGSHLVMNGNTGLALDFGFNYNLSKYYSFSGSLLDVGFINWKENISNDIITDTTFSYSGVDLDGIGNVRDVIVDSLLRNFETRESSESYRTWLPLKAYGSWIYHYTDNTDLYASVGTRILHGQIKMLYGGGVTHRFGQVFTASLSATKLPQQFFNLGAAFVVNGGPVQLYMAADQVINFSVTDLKAFDFRFGINFRIKDKNPDGLPTSKAFKGAITTGSKGVSTNAFLGKQVKTKRKEGIYSVIKRQKKRAVSPGDPRSKKKIKTNNKRKGYASPSESKSSKVRTKSLNGLGGRRGGGVPARSVQKKSLNGRSATKGGSSSRKPKVQKKSLSGRKFN